MPGKEIETFAPSNPRQWRQWLQKHHDSKQSVWVVFYKKKTGIPTITWSEAVDEALCFGWIDGQARPIDEEKSMRLFSRRKPNGTWSKINKEKVKRLEAAGLMKVAGFKAIAAAKQNGSWTILDDVEELTIPRDLQKEFRAHRGSKKSFLTFSKSVRKAILQWIVLAKRAETRQKRVEQVAALAARGEKPKHI